MAGRPLLLRLLLAVVDRASRLVPASRRHGWRRQWHADLADAWRRGAGAASVGAPAAASYLVGILRHALWLRGHVRRTEMISHDLRYGWRLMLRRPVFTATAIVTLGLGIGANATVYSWVDAVLLNPIAGARDANRLVLLNGTTRDRSDLSISWPNFVDMRRLRPGTVEDLLVSRSVALTLRTTGDPERVWGQLVSANFFDVLGITPLLGRGFEPEEDRAPNGTPVAVVSHAFWRNHLDGDPSIVGRTVTINNRAFTVIGVAPPSFVGNQAGLAFDVWIPMMMQPVAMPGDRLNERGNLWLQAMVRLKPEVPIARAQTDFDVLARNLADAYQENRDRGLRLSPLWRAPGTAGAIMLPVLAVLTGVAAVVLLIACANIAGLLLARAADRRRETAVRLALGASRSRIVQQLLTETLLVAIAGGVVGALAASWTAGLLSAFFPPARLPIAVHPSVDASVLAFTMFVTLGCALVCGIVPAFQGSRARLVPALKDGPGSVAATPHRARLRRALVVAQVALSLVLLVSAGLFLQTLRHATALDPGFSLRNGLMASIDLLPAGYEAPAGAAALRDIASRVRELPGVEAATLTQYVPLSLSGVSDFYVQVDGYTPAPDEELSVYYTRVGVDYLRTMGIRLVDGRGITDRDTAQLPDVGIINETMARRYWRGRNPIGGRIRAGSRVIEVVGVAADGKYGTIGERPRNFLYLPLQQWYRPDTVLVVRTAAEPLSMLPAVRQAVRAVDPSLLLFDVETMDEHLVMSVFLQRMAASLLGGFGLVALLLATTGLYGVIAAAVSERTAEIGMRMALGATRHDILSLVLTDGLVVTGVGLAIGLGAAAGVAQLVKSQLIGVGPTDLASFATMSALLLAVALAATYVPAYRAASIDPLLALRRE